MNRRITYESELLRPTMKNGLEDVCYQLRLFFKERKLYNYMPEECSPVIGKFKIFIKGLCVHPDEQS